MSPGRLSAQSLPFRCASLAEGLSQSVVNAVLEDSAGYLWVGTANGLSRYDGQEFVNFDNAQGLPSPRIYSLLEDPAGVLWAGTDRGIARYAPPQWQAASGDGPLASSRVLSMVVDPTVADGSTLLIGTQRRGLFIRRSDGSIEQVESDGPNTISSLLHLDGRVWAGTDQGLFRWSDGRLTAAEIDAPWNGSTVEDLATDDHGGLLLATAEGGFRLGPGDSTWQRLVAADAGALTAVAPGSGSDVWFATHHTGMLRWRDNRLDRLTTNEGLPTQGQRALLRHSDHGLWIGTYGAGLCRLNDQSFALFTKEHGLPNDQVLSMVEDADGHLWIALLEGGIARYDGEGFRIYDQDDGLRSLAVSHLTIDGEGNLWAATLRGGGLHRLAPGEDSFVNIPLESHREPLIFHLQADGEGRLWIATWQRGIYQLDPASGESRHVMEGLISPRVFSTSRSQDGRIWIATDRGVQTFDPDSGTFQGFEEAQNPPQGRVRGIAHDASTGHAFLATDLGLAHWDGQRFDLIGRDRGLASNNLYLVILDRQRRLWVGSERGLDRFQWTADEQLEDLRHFGDAEGFVGLETNQNATYEDRQERLWFGTHGLARFDPREERSVATPPRLHLTQLRTFDGVTLPLDGKDTLTLPWDRNDLVFEFIGLDFLAPKAVRYRYRLHGPRDDWSPLSASRSAIFPNLASGSYTFEVRARGRGGRSEVQRFRFEIRPPFWSTWWFRAGLVLTLAFAIALWLWRRETVNRQRRLELEKAVEERTRELASAKQMAEDASAAKSEFLSNMSHELRTPLTGVVSASELLSVTPLTGRQMHLIETIQTSGRALLSVVNDILDQSKIEARGLLIDAREFSPAVCFEECLQIVRHNAEVKGLDLQSTLGPGIPDRAVGDPVRFRQVLINLLGNAIKFTDQGKVAASLQRGEERGERLQLLVQVSDSGMGIPEEIQERIFEPFEQADMSLSRSFGGTGLGLSICRRLVAMMNGSISVDSRVDEGSTFRFDIEVGLAAGGSPQLAPASPALPKLRGNLKVLVAEDNPVSQMITDSQLESLGIHSQITSNGSDAVQLAKESRPDLIFMDGQMPGMDGYSATQAIREAEGDDRHAIIIGFTAHATSEARGRCLAAGMDDYLAKPVTIERLAECIAHWFPDDA